MVLLQLSHTGHCRVNLSLGVPGGQTAVQEWQGAVCTEGKLPAGLTVVGTRRGMADPPGQGTGKGVAFPSGGEIRVQSSSEAWLFPVLQVDGV